MSKSKKKDVNKKDIMLTTVYFALADLTDLDGDNCLEELWDEPAMIHSEDWSNMQSNWYQCLLAAVTYEKSHRGWNNDPRFDKCMLDGQLHVPQGPAGQVIDLFIHHAEQELLSQEEHLHDVVGGWTSAAMISSSSLLQSAGGALSLARHRAEAAAARLRRQLAGQAEGNAVAS
mmetsp:Transcript_112989/g.274367  ORF Transcript_112989/g.274367 Transcript_112989/m.274367 type:complete len:174 (+) Transcript_112989:229-750(+)